MGAIRRRQQPSHLLEDLVAIGPSDHEAKEIADLGIAQPDPLAHVGLVRANLPLDHVTEPKTTGNGSARVFVLEDLDRKITVAHDLEQAERHDSPDSPGALVPWLRSPGILQRISSIGDMERQANLTEQAWGSNARP